MNGNSPIGKPGLAVLLCLALLAPLPGIGRDFFLQEGTEIYLRLHTTVDTKISQAGDRFISTVEEPVLLDNIEVIPVGARVLGRVGEVRKPRRLGGRGGRLVLTFESIEVPGAGTVQIAGSLVDIYDPDTIENEDDTLKGMDIGSEGEVKASSAGKIKRLSTVLAGGGIGIAAGAGAGGAIGGAVGAAVAFVVLKGKQVELPAGIGLVMRIDRGITLSVPDLPSPGEKKARAKNSKNKKDKKEKDNQQPRKRQRQR